MKIVGTELLQFEPGGHFRLRLDKNFRARERALWNTIRAKHAPEYSGRGIFGKLALRWRMHREYHQEWKKIAPSIYALF